MVRVKADGSTDPVEARFQERFSVSSTLRRASLFIYNVTVTDDKVNGEFRCELVDSNAENWIRAIQVQVIVSLKVLLTVRKGTLSVVNHYSILLFGPALNEGRTWKI